MTYYIIGAISAICIIYLIITMNSINKLIIKVEEAFANVDVYLKKRYDLIPNLVETVKGYAKHEESTFKELAKYRAEAMKSNDFKTIDNANKNISNALGKIMFISEAYPELKADSNFRHLQETLSSIEGELVNARKYYNGSVRLYNNKVVMIPSSIIATMMNKSKMEYLTIEAGERNNVSVKF